jgi:hypothetical protein
MSFIAAAAAAGTTVAAMQAAAIAGATAAQVAAATTAAATASALASTAAAASLPSAAMLSTGAATGIAPGVVAPLIPAVIPTAAGIGGAMPSAAMLAEGAATGIAPGVASGGLGALPTTVATTAVPALAEQSFSQVTKEAAKTAGKEVGEGASKEALTAGNQRFLQNSMAGNQSGGMTIAKPPTTPAPAPSNLVSVTPPKTPTLPQAGPMNYGKSISPTDVVKAPTKPMNTFDAAVKAESSPLNMSGDVGGINESMNAAAQRQASADAFGGVGTAYEPAITKTPVEKSFLDKAGEFVMNNKMNIAMGGLGLAQMMPPESGVNPISEDMIRPYTYSEEDTSDQEADPRGREKIRYSSSYAAGTPYKAAQGGLLSLHRGGNFLSGRGDGMSDDIPAMIGTKQPARLADGEFVIPADVVSHIGNGSSKAGAEKLYAMMDKIRKERTGRKRQSPQINAAKYLPR